MKNKPQRTQSAQSKVKKSKEKDSAVKKEIVLWTLPGPMHSPGLQLSHFLGTNKNIGEAEEGRNQILP
jgi:hypothetical protein